MRVLRDHRRRFRWWIMLCRKHRLHRRPMNAIEATRSRVDRILTAFQSNHCNILNFSTDCTAYYVDVWCHYKKRFWKYGEEGFKIDIGMEYGGSTFTYEYELKEDSLQELKSVYSTYEDIAVGKIKRTLQAEDVLARGRTKLRQAGKQIQGVISSCCKIDRQATGLKDALRELPSREAPRFRREVTDLAKEAKKEKNTLSKEATKISNHGLSV